MTWKEDLSALTDKWTEHQFVGTVSMDHADTGLPQFVVIVAGEDQAEMEKRLHAALAHGLMPCNERECPLGESE